MTRYAVVHQGPGGNVAAYLPDNYEVVSTHAASPDGTRSNVVIRGTDSAGWTLDGYVLPRLASGLYFGREHPTLDDAQEAACASMN